MEKVIESHGEIKELARQTDTLSAISAKCILANARDKYLQKMPI